MVSSRSIYFPLCLAEAVNKQECIPVGCVPSAAVPSGGGGVYPSMHWAGGVSVRGGLCAWGCLLHTSPLDRMTDACEEITVKNHQKSRCGQIDATLVSRGKTFTLDKNENILFYRHSSSKVILLISFSTCNWKNLTTNRKWTEETSQVVQIHCLKHRKILFFTILLHQNHKLWQY